MRLSLGLGTAFLCAWTASFFAAVEVSAQSSPETIAKVSQLFTDAKALMAEQNYAEACPKLEEATQLAPEGIGGKVKLAECYKGWGKLASAYRAYKVAAKAAADAGQSERKTKCEQ